MKKMIVWVTILYFFICAVQAGAVVCSKSHYYAPNDIETATGTIQVTRRNSIEIYDEFRKREERFIYFDYGEGLHKGDYVRVYYHPQGAIVQSIKKMTILEYKENGQNLGNIFHTSSS